jgi:hypothetical protein
VPAFFLFGANDRLIPVERSVAVIRDVMTKNGRADFKVRVFEGVDHTMHDANGLLDQRYLTAMQNWLGERVLNAR